MVEKQYKEFIQEEYETLKNNIYKQTNIINIKELDKKTEELLNLQEYLPVLIRNLIPYKYYTIIDTWDNYKEIEQKIINTRKQTPEENHIEFINWIDTHKKYNTLLNEKNVKKIGDEIEELENTFKKYIK